MTRADWALVAAAATTLLGVRQVAIWWRLWGAPKRLRGDRAGHIAAVARVPAQELRLVFVIPCYEEVDTLPATFAALHASVAASRHRAEIVIVTSGVETARAAADSRTRWTRDIAERLCAISPHARCVENTDPRPTMAKQFNTGLELAARTHRGYEDRTWVVCYNADTTAAPDSTEALGDALLAGGRAEVGQLMCVSLRNTDRMRGAFGWYLVGAAYYQARWALGFEFDMYRRAARRLPWPRSYYLRGHGLTLRLDTAARLGGLSSATALEDMLFGFRLSLRDVPVHVVPVLEATEHPSALRELVAQKAHWFSGMADVTRYGRLLPGELAARRSLFRWLQAHFLQRDAFGWLVGPVVPAALLVQAAAGGVLWFAALPVLNAVLTVVLVRRAARAGGIDVRVRVPAAPAAVPLGVLAYSCTRNLGPVIHVLRRVWRRPWR